MLLLLFFIGWLIAEVIVVIEVAEAIGILLTIALLIAGWPIGIWALRSQGRVAWRRLTAAVSAGRPPAREVADGALVLVGGILLMIPGFITDILGICVLLAPTRALLRRLLIRNFRSRVVVRAAGVGREPYDVDSTASDLDRHRLES
ncbi:MAG: FxsA family protein [Solirubrobacterales bacterium]|nr:FxsA family protein [Solirubrobacterales bacterium]